MERQGPGLRWGHGRSRPDAQLRLGAVRGGTSMAQNDSVVRSNRRIVVLLAVVAVVWLGMVAWAVTRGENVEAVGHAIVACLAVATAYLASDPQRDPAKQRRIMIAAFTLVPIAIVVFVLSWFF